MPVVASSGPALAATSSVNCSFSFTTCRGRPCVVPIGCVMIQSFTRAAGCYATTTQVFRELREAMRQRASIRGVSLMGPGQEGAIAGRPAHDHRMNSPSSGTHTAHYLFACDDCNQEAPKYV